MRKAFHIYLQYYLHIMYLIISSRDEGRPLPMCATGAAEPRLADINNNVATCCLHEFHHAFSYNFTIIILFQNE